jgi:LCP family protein required for cell wall assembly
MTTVAALSATAGALLAFSLSRRPLMQSRLTPQQAAVFDSDAIAGSGLQYAQLTRPVNLLLLGMSVLPEDIKNPPTEAQHLSYSPEVNSFEGLSDTMLLLRFDPETQKVVVLSIPRDTRVTVEGHGVEKINAANVRGGAALSAKTVSQLLGGVEIDRYMRINVLGVAKLIDALGGIDFYVPKAMHYKDDTQHLYIDLKPGQQHLNGERALQLLRFRYDALGDIGRIQRQQLLMRALMAQALSPATLARLPQILSAVQSNIDTNLSVGELVALSGFTAQTPRSHVQMLMVPGDFSSGGQSDVSYWLPNQSAIQKIMSQYFDLSSAGMKSASDPASLRVAIQDSTGRPQSVSTLVHRLQKAGYSQISVERPWPEKLSVTHIVAQQGDENSAALLDRVLGVGEVRVETTGALYSDVTIRLGTDWQPRREESNVTENQTGREKPHHLLHSRSTGVKKL